jgi:hypothetical protein
MKKLFIIITTGLFSLTALAQPTPTTFLDVQITGSKETVAQQLMDAGFTEFTKLDMYEGEFMGEQVTVRISWWKPAKQVSSLFISGTQKYESAEAIRKFHNILSEFEKDPKYTADPANRRIPAGATLSHEYLSDNRSFEAKFYQDGHKNKTITCAVAHMDGLFYIRWLYSNKYNSGK